MVPVKIENIINALDNMIEDMTTKRDQYIGRAHQLDDDIDRLRFFRASLHRNVVEHEIKEDKPNENND